MFWEFCTRVARPNSNQQHSDTGVVWLHPLLNVMAVISKIREVPGWLAYCLWCAMWPSRSESFIKMEGLVMIRIGRCRLGWLQRCSRQRPENILQPNHVCSFFFSCRSRVKKKLKKLCGMRRLKVCSYLWYCIEAWCSLDMSEHNNCNMTQNKANDPRSLKRGGLSSIPF